MALIVLMVRLLCTRVQTHQIVYVNWLHCLVQELYFNKAGGGEKRALRSLLPTSLDTDLMTTAQTPPWDLVSHAAESYTSCCKSLQLRDLP